MVKKFLLHKAGYRKPKLASARTRVMKNKIFKEQVSKMQRPSSFEISNRRRKNA